jgi:hypothetical protein
MNFLRKILHYGVSKYLNMQKKAAMEPSWHLLETKGQNYENHWLRTDTRAKHLRNSDYIVHVSVCLYCTSILTQNSTVYIAGMNCNNNLLGEEWKQVWSLYCWPHTDYAGKRYSVQSVSWIQREDTRDKTGMSYTVVDSTGSKAAIYKPFLREYEFELVLQQSINNQ